MSRIALILIAAYLLGSIPFGYLLVRVFRGEDVRKSGSGNIGATNVSRKSPALGAFTLLLDAAKGFLSVQLATYSGLGATDNGLQRLMAGAALFAIVGHMFPVWLRFRGGKGVATGVGIFLVLAPIALLCAGVIFVAIVALTRYVSLGSIIAALLIPVFVWWQSDVRPSLIAAVAGAALIVFAHRGNIKRLASRTESRI